MRFRLLMGLLLPVILTVCLTGCSTPVKKPGELCRVELERGHGSMWGNQFHILVSRGEILSVSRFPENAGEVREYTTEYNIPISPEDWQEIETLISSMDLEEEKEPFLQRLGLLSQKLDGGEFHTLKLVYAAGEKTKETEYLWTGSPRQTELEALLEDLANAHNNE